MTIKEKIIELSDQLLTFLLKYRETHPNFRFWMRSREHNKAGDKERLSKGQWFQGSDYIFLSFHSASGHVNMTRSIGWVVEFNNHLKPRTFISIVWPREDDSRKIALYKDIIEQLKGFEKSTETKYHKILQEQDVFASLQYFLDNTYPQINKIIREHGLSDAFTIPEEKFQKQLSKITYHRNLIYNTNDEGVNEEDSNAITKVYSPLNIILYGPPGTGKTYNAIDKAVEIASPGFDRLNSSRMEIKDEYDRLVENKQVEFITFHQSLSYEDFIEGIKPVKPENATNLHYEIVDGVFKRICLEATRTSQFSVTIDEITKPLTKELFEEFYYSFSEGLPLYTEPVSLVELSTKENYKFQLFRNTVDSIAVKAGQKRTNSIISCKELTAVLFENKPPTYKSYEQIVINKILEDKNFKSSSIDNSRKNFVLIIDEINRGNVSQVFGELITLIEDDKRSGNDEALKLTLPYSKKPFEVPSNLFIVGTMNTADRSVEALDTALRRRFVFEEKGPDPELLTPERIVWKLWWDYEENKWDDPIFLSIEKPLYKLLGFPADLDEDDKKEEYWAPMKKQGIDISQSKSLAHFKFTGINLSKLLVHINKRIEKLLSKDYSIGHAYLIHVASLDDLRRVFRNKILPLLQEYFFGDYARIGLVIGEVFIRSVKPDPSVDLLTVSGYETGDLNHVKVYQIQDMQQWDEETFILNVKAIYGE